MATLKISDLSVGDWVEFKGELCKVLECGTIIVSPRTIEFKPRLILSAKYDIYDCVDVDKVRPIPITAEVLEKNGWERNEEDEYMEYYGDPTSGIAHTKGTFRCQLEVPGVSVVCYFVHQLQHALRLAGVDKEINL